MRLPPPVCFLKCVRCNRVELLIQTYVVLNHSASEVAQWLACWAHNPKVPESKPGFATANECSRGEEQGSLTLTQGRARWQPRRLSALCRRRPAHTSREWHSVHWAVFAAPAAAHLAAAPPVAPRTAKQPRRPKPPTSESRSDGTRDGSRSFKTTLPSIVL